MNFTVSPDHAQSCEKVALRICEIVRQKPNAKLGLATGSTPEPVYRRLAQLCKEGAVDFSHVRTVNLDEYWGLAPTHPQSYRYYMDQNLFNHINIDKANTYVADGLADPDRAAAALDEAVFAGGAPDFQLLGIGGNGHIAFNEAGERLSADSHVVALTQSTIDANARFFENAGQVPRKAITMGMKGILAAAEVWLLASGAAKQNAVRGLVEDGAVTTQNPATFLKLHQNAHILIDEALAKLVGLQGG